MEVGTGELTKDGVVTGSEDQTSAKIDHDLDKVIQRFPKLTGIGKSIAQGGNTRVSIRSRVSFFDGEEIVLDEVPSNVLLDIKLNKGKLDEEQERYFYGNFATDGVEKRGLRKVIDTQGTSSIELEQVQPTDARVIISALDQAATDIESKTRIDNLRRIKEAETNRNNQQPEEPRKPERRVKIAIGNTGGVEILPSDPLYNKK